MVLVRINANVKARTVEELRTQKKDMHVSAFRYMLAETARDLERIAEEERCEDRIARDGTKEVYLQWWLDEGGRQEWLQPGMSDGTVVAFTAAGLLARILQQCEAVLERHVAEPPDRFHDDETYRYMVTEMLETRAAAVSSLRSYIEKNNTISTFWKDTIFTSHRDYLNFMEQKLPAEDEARAAAAARLCRVMGAMRSSVDETDVEGFTPLMRATADGAGARVLRCLVAARADVNAREALQTRSALFLAAEFGFAEAVEVLARLGGDVDAAGYPPWDTTPMYVAAQGGYTAVIEALGRVGADVNKALSDGRTPMFVAADGGHTAAIEALVKLRADVNRADNDGDTPLDAATNCGHPAAADALRRLGAK